MIKQWFIVFAVALFSVYCVGVVFCHGKVPVPHYEVKSIDLFGGYDGDVNSPKIKEHLHNIARLNYLRMPNSHNANFAEEVLTEEKLREIVATNPEAARHYTVVDPTKVHDLSRLGYHFAEDTTIGNATFRKGSPISLPALNAVIRSGKFKVLRASGHGETIAIQPGTMLMVMIIFVALLCGLKIVLFDPLIKIIDERNAEINTGNFNRRENALLARKLDKECADVRAAMRRDHLNDIAEAHYIATLEADKILHKAHEEARLAHDAMMAQLRDVQVVAEREIKKSVPDLAEQIVQKTLGFALK